MCNCVFLVPFLSLLPHPLPRPTQYQGVWSELQSLVDAMGSSLKSPDSYSPTSSTSPTLPHPGLTNGKKARAVTSPFV